MSEPETKKAKTDRRVFDFKKDDEPCDHDLIVGNSVFSIQSKTMIEHSEYFRVMFTSDFIEKGKKEIVLKEVEEKEMEVFLTVLFEPEEFDLRAEHLPVLCKLFTYFQASIYLWKFLEKNDAFEMFSGDLLPLSVENSIPAVKDSVEKVLISKFVEKYPVTTEKSEETAAGFKINEFFINSLNLAEDYELKLLKANVDVRLTSDYVRSRHFAVAEVKYVEVLSIYQLEDLKKAIEQYAISICNERPLHMILSRYIDKAKPVTMDQLKNTLENSYIDQYRKTRDVDYYIRQVIFNQYGMEKLKEGLDYIKNDLITRFHDMLARMDVDENTFKIEHFKHSYRFFKLEKIIEKTFLDKMNNGDPIHEKLLTFWVDHVKRKNVEKLTEATDDYLTSDFEKTRSLKNINYGIGTRYESIRLPKFEDYVAQFLKTANLEDVKTGREYILKLKDDKKAVVLDALLNNHDA